jgi:hypothetical protein
MGILADMGYGAVLGPELQGKVLKPFEKAVTVTELDEPNKAMMEAAGYKKGGAVKMAGGGMHKNMLKALAKHAAKPASKAHAGLKAGGYVRAADGVTRTGKTKGRTI